MVINSFEDWLETPQGLYVRTWASTRTSRVVSNIFGYHALQIGMPSVDLLVDNRMPYRWRCSASSSCANVHAYEYALPFDCGSLDLVILAYVLEFSEDPHQVLRETERVLVPEGRVLILGFNPFSLWGLHRKWAGPQAGFPWCGQYLSLHRLKDWLKLLGFETQSGGLGCYAPAWQNASWLEDWRFMDAAGDRWWPVCGAVYMLEGIKRVHGMRLLTPNWRQSSQKNTKSVVVVPPSRAQHKGE